MEIIARLTADAVVKTVKENRQVVNFSVAINDSYRVKGSAEVTKLVTYVDCSYWGHQGIVPYLTKGSLVQLSGRISVNAYVSQHGEPKAALRFHVNQIQLHGGGRRNENAVNHRAVTVVTGELTEPLEDLPF